jgi:molybdopterin synthase sulfur carrier subunit
VPARVHVPTLLQSYTGAAEVEARGATLAEVLRDLDARFPGLRFRIIDEQDRVRPHVKLFVRSEATRDLATAVRDGDEVHIVGALSGG